MNNLLTQAERDFQLIETIYCNLPEPWAVQAIMYHLQQAIEKLLKVLILLGGSRYPRECNIRGLMSLCQEEALPTELDDLADTLTLWKAGARYDSCVLTSERKLNQCIDVYHKLHGTVISKMYYVSGTNHFKDTD